MSSAYQVYSKKTLVIYYDCANMNYILLKKKKLIKLDLQLKFVYEYVLLLTRQVI